MKFKLFSLCFFVVWCFSVHLIFNGETPRYMHIVELHAQEILSVHAKSTLLL